MSKVLDCLILVLYSYYVLTSSCDPPWSKFKDNCYYFYNTSLTLQPKSWNESRMICQLLGGDLLSIADMEEQTFINSFFNDSTVKRKNYWIGLTDSRNEGAFEWIDGTPYNASIFNYWRTENGEPNNYMNNEDCAETTWDGKWNDNNCQTQFGFICKRNSDVKPKTPTLPPYPDTTDKPTTCEAGWIPWGTSCYGIIKGIPKNWHDARADCMRRFGDLLIIDSQAENDFITYELSPLRSEYWIGLTDQGLSKSFHWVDGTPLNKTLNVNWRQGEPSNSFLNEDCVEIYGHWQPGKWNDNHCTSIRDYICEKKSGVHNCPDGWIPYEDYCYQINAHPNQKASFQEARRICLGFNKPWKSSTDVANADLVSIHSASEQNFLDSKFRELGVRSSTEYYWTGLVKKNSSFGWTDHSNFDYQNWKSQPSSNKNNCTKTSISLYGLGWEASNCGEKNLYVCKVKKGQDRCYDPIGIQNFKIPDTSFSASSQMSITTPPFAAKLYLKAGNSLDGAWCAAKNDKEPWIQIDFGKPERLTYMAIQGKSNSAALVLGYYMKYSMDGVSWDVYGDVPPAGYIKFKTRLSWRSDYEKALNLPLPNPLIAQYVRIYPIKNDCHQDCCMRLEFYGCPIEVNSQYCGVGWKRDPATKHCYQLNTKKTTWDAAESLCMAQGSHLLSITSFHEQDFVKNLLKPLSGRTDDYWMGLTDQDEEGIYLFSDQSPLVVDFWYPSFHRLDASKNCIAVRSNDGSWNQKDCTEFREFICKKTYTSSFTPKKPFNGNLATATDLFWSMDKVINNQVVGTKSMNVFGNFTSVPFNQMVNYLAFDGKSSYLNSVSLEKTCASHPDSSSCPHGLSVSFVFKYDDIATMATILDTLGDRADTVGFKVYIQNKQIVTMLRGAEKYYISLDDFKSNEWHQFFFTWSPLNGLKVYLDGKKTSTNTNHGASNPRYLSKEAVQSLFVGTSASADKFAKIAMGSLSIYERVLASTEIESSYLSVFGKCRAGQISHGSFCYEFNTKKVQWSSANTDCEERGGFLASVHSSVEHSFITSKCGPGSILNRDMWIGFSALRKEPFRWSDSSDALFTAWTYGQPNTGSQYYSSRLCVYAMATTGKWKSQYCYSRKGYICKFQKSVKKEKPKNDVQNVVVSYFGSLTIGCPLKQHLKIIEVIYGSKRDNCYMDKETAKKVVSEKCSQLSCVLRASDSFLKTTKCQSARWKNLNVTYSCVEDAVTKPSKCDGYEISMDGLSCYKLFKDKLTFTEAGKQCSNGNAILATISGKNEQNLLTSMLSKLTSQTDIWVGLKYNTKEQKYEWLNGAPVTYTKWINKQPNPSLGTYVKVGVESGLKPMLWKPANENEELPFFCQKSSGQTTTAPPTTTPSTEKKICYNGWVEHKGYCYFYNAKRLSFVDAEKNCSTLVKDGHTTSIMDNEENDFLWKLIYNTTGGNDVFTWLGLENEGLVNGFRWKDGNPLFYVNWYPSRPYTGNRHLCGGMENNGQWFDLPCYSKYPSICKMKKIDISKTTTAAPTFTPDPSLKCGTGWKGFNRSCFFFSSRFQTKDYNQATADCLSRNATLASVLNQHENKFIADERKKGYYTRLLIGMRDTSSGWSWNDGSVAKYLNFDENQPDNWEGLESCVEIKSNGKWNDVPCNMKASYVCRIYKDKHVLPTQVVPTDGGYCDYGWELYGNNCYLFQLEEGQDKSFKDARDFCRTLHKSELASVHSRYENSFIAGHAKSNNFNIYIGLTDFIRERTFIWTDQTSFTYSNWATGEPSFYQGNEDCVEIRTYYKLFGKWNDIGCEKKNGFVCKKPSSLTKPTGNPPSEKNPCPAGFKKYDQSCYHFAKEPKTWDIAANNCQKKGSLLLSITNFYEHAYIFSQFVEYANTTWLGLSREVGKQKFKYVDDSPLRYTFWKNLLPSFSTFNESQCVTQNAEFDGKWMISNCFKKFPYICKINRNPVVEPLFVGNCSEGWNQYNGMCYKYFNNKKLNWPQARKNCMTYGGDLATIKHYDIQKYLEYLTKDDTQRVWIGLNDREKEHFFKWSSGVAFNQGESFANWNNDEPNDSAGKENCVEMFSAHGKWNDLSCSLQLNYLCEHSLECQDSAGFENGKLADENFVASSNYSTNLPQNARLNGQSAWCTNITSGIETLTVNLQNFMHVTRISTQGGRHDRNKDSWVLSYQLEYSIDGDKWQLYNIYSQDGYSQTLPGNNDFATVQSNKVDIRATYLRFTPKKFKGSLMCMRIEVFGCQSVCLNPLTAVSDSFITSDEKYQRQAQPPTLLYFPFCPKNFGKEVFYQLTFKKPVKVNRFTVQSQGKSFFKYRVMYHMDRKNTTLKPVYDTRVSTSRLDVGFIADQITIVIIQPTRGICLKAEFYGCLFECDSELGLHSKKLPDYLMIAKSEKTGFPASAGRLDGGYYNRNSWCAAFNNLDQYLQIDLTQEAHVTGIASQGFYGSQNRYVSRYILQWSNDGDLWKQHPKQIQGNRDGESTVKNKIVPAIQARYIRVIPTEFQNEICMRIELYGCSFEISGGVVPDSKKSSSDEDSHLSNGGKIGLIVFFVILIVTILVLGVAYYIRHRRGGFILQKSFSNPVHMDINNDEIDIINYAE